MYEELTAMIALVVTETGDLSRRTAVCKLTKRPGVGLTESSIFLLFVVEGATPSVVAASL